ncbi:MAG: cupin domain-containing protein [Bacteroidaceae bacterium]|nr:cupin domain-containing protein [Bacteroidaceae bacterium]
MQIILLSGGSGKRLWPLSNGTRAKQFLQLLPAPDGGLESMVQRVVRQLHEHGFGENINFATSLAQKDQLCNQVKGNVNFITEPEHRGTLPAISLSALYLSEHRHCDNDEIVMVMPCDSFVSEAYYEALRRAIKVAEERQAKFTLLGIRPISETPFTRYGYIFSEPPSDPTNPDAHSRVIRFYEKPEPDVARTLIMQGALWNAGVFVFRLGDMLSIAKEQFGALSYSDLYARYSKLPKLSFDRMVIEKETDLAVVRYAGEWKDLGSWNSLLEETNLREMGNVMIGHDVVNTHIINELDQPLLCVGTHNMVVAATSDGILVSRKDISSTIKHSVDQLEVRPMYEERRWGSYKVISNLTFPDGARALTKLLCISAGKNISYQIHHHRDELWTFVDGTGELVIDDVQRTVTRGDVALIKSGQRHAVKATTDLKIIEVQSGSQLVEEDIERFDWAWK